MSPQHPRVAVVTVVSMFALTGCSTQDSPGGVTTPSADSNMRPAHVSALVERSLDMTQPYWSGYVTYSSSGAVWSETSVIDPVTTYPTHTYPVSVPSCRPTARHQSRSSTSWRRRSCREDRTMVRCSRAFPTGVGARWCPRRGVTRRVSRSARASRTCSSSGREGLRSSFACGRPSDTSGTASVSRTTVDRVRPRRWIVHAHRNTTNAGMSRRWRVGRTCRPSWTRSRPGR